MKIQNALVSNIFNRSQRYFAHVTTVTLSWHVQNIVVIGRVYFTLKCFEFSSNFEFDRNMLSGTGAWSSVWFASMMTSSNGNIFRVTGHLCGEFTRPRWIPHTSQWRGALLFSLIYARTNGWVNTGEAGDLRRNHAHHDVIVMRRCFVAFTSKQFH